MGKSSNIICKKKCCKLYITQKIINQPEEFINDKTYKIRAGILLFDNFNRILLSQSYNCFWGVPKGAKEENETNEEASIRELKEETGISIDQKLLENAKIKAYIISKKLYLFFITKIDCSEHEYVVKNPSDFYNESTGCGWINLDCLHEFYTDKKIKINYVTKLLLNDYTSSDWQ